jgi:hypothetical protein
VGGAALLTVGIIAAPVIIVGSIYAFNAEARQDLARGVDYVLSGGEGYVWEDAPPAQVAVPDVCTHTVDDILVMAKGGKQNLKGGFARRMQEEAAAAGKDICTFLAEQRMLAKATGDTELENALVQLQKAFGCRNVRKRR